MQRAIGGPPQELGSDKQNGPRRPLGEEKDPGNGEVWVWPDRTGDTHIRGHGGTQLAALSRSVLYERGLQSAESSSLLTAQELRKFP